MWLRLSVVLILFSVSVKSVPLPIVIKTGISKASEHEQHQDGGVYDAAAKNGITTFEGGDGFDVENKRNFAKGEDGGNYAEEHADKKHHLEEGDYNGEKFHDLGGGTIADFGAKVGHKKGHHKSGFHNTYHKDESGSNTSYYDDGADHGDQNVYHTRKGTYGDVGRESSHGSHLDGSEYAKGGDRYGGYNNGGAYEKDVGAKRQYDQKQYYDDHALKGRSNAGSRYGEAGYDEQAKFHSKPPYYPPHRPHYYDDYHYGAPAYRAPLPPVAPLKKTITIYEDPRVDVGRRDYVEPQYTSDDYVQLDVKRSPAYYDYRYSDQKPYDDYYY